MPPPVPSQQLRRLLLRTLTSSTSATSHRNHCLYDLKPLGYVSAPTYFSKVSSLPFRYFSSESLGNSETLNPQDSTRIALSLSKELLANPDADSLSVSQNLQLSFSHIKPNADLILQTLNLSPEAGRGVLGFSQWLVSNAKFTHTDETLSYFVDFFGRRKDFKAAKEMIYENKGVAGAKTLESAIDRLVRAGRPTKVIGFFENMEKDYGFKRDKESLRMVVEKLSDKGYASYAEKLVKNSANEIFPDEHICFLLIKAWCVDEKLDEATRLAGEMYEGGFEIGTEGYNWILDCVCKLCRKKDPFRLQFEAEKVLLEMDQHGVPRNSETFNVMTSNLCKIRKTEDAMKLFGRMGEWGCYPNAEIYLTLIKSLYQAARIGEGDEMIDQMKSAGFGDSLDKKAYYDFLKILCGIERLDHSMSVFKKMKADGCKPGIKTYDLLMGKWCAHNKLDKANALFQEAYNNGVSVTPKEYRVDPRFLKKKTKEVKSKTKKRLTLPEKTARKRSKLKQIRLSFVKKTKRMMN